MEVTEWAAPFRADSIRRPFLLRRRLPILRPLHLRWWNLRTNPTTRRPLLFVAALPDRRSL